MSWCCWGAGRAGGQRDVGAAMQAAGSARADQLSGGPCAPQVRRYMPFLEGSRQCVGMSLARMTTAATVAALLSRFTFRLADEVRAVLRVRVRVQ